MPRRSMRFRWDEIALDKVTEMVARKVVGRGGQTVTQTYLKKGALVPRHTHEGDQWIYVLQGALALVVDAESQTVREGEIVHLPGGVAHQAEALDDTFVIDFRQEDHPHETPEEGLT